MSLTDNKTKIQQLIAGINALPEAGSGGSSVETCAVTFVNCRNFLFSGSRINPSTGDPIAAIGDPIGYDDVTINFIKHSILTVYDDDDWSIYIDETLILSNYDLMFNHVCSQPGLGMTIVLDTDELTIEYTG